MFQRLLCTLLCSVAVTMHSVASKIKEVFLVTKVILRIQWNPSIPDTPGTAYSIMIVKEVSLFLGIVFYTSVHSGKSLKSSRVAQHHS